MSLFTVLETLLIGPLKLAFEIIFAVALKLIGHPGYTIIAFSFVMNILVLPLYRQADALQEQARDVEARLHKGVAHIKKTFSGDERMMILQTYYRQNDYRPTDALKGSVSLLLEIPFFMAAYQFLSHLGILEGASLGPIADLSRPDALLVIGSVTINLLPVLMTLINVVSSAIYLRGFPMKTKVQLYGMALFFLVFLYNSPAGLVFYWTLNNLFSLVKTVFYKLKNPRRILCILCTLAGLALPFAAGTFLHIDTLKKKIFIIALALVLQLPLLLGLLRKSFPALFRAPDAKPDQKLFFLGSLFLTVLVGLLIPSTFIAASPQEFVDPTYFHHPMWYLVSSACMAAGFFLIWLRVFYGLATDSFKVIFDRLIWVLCGIMLVNYMFFGTDLGIISANLQYENNVIFSRTEQLVNLLVLCGVALVMYVLAIRQKKAVVAVLLTAVIAVGGMSALNLRTVHKSVAEVSIEKVVAMPEFRLSKSGRNVVVLMLDRAMGELVPYLFNERPDLEERFDGFTYYSNTVSFGGFTNFGVPALYGGYEYTPVEMNRRSDELLVDKHNEALKVMPVLFSENGYEVTVCDPVYANYQWIPDLSIYDDYPEIDTYISKGKLTETKYHKMLTEQTQRNFFVFSLMKSMPLLAQRTLYNEGQYLHMLSSEEMDGVCLWQRREGLSKSSGITKDFIDSYNILANLSSLTEITAEDTDTFLALANDTTHEVILLSAPDYVPVQTVDNTEYDAAHTDRFTLNGRTLNAENDKQMMHYQCNMAAMLLLADWFDYLRENGVYDNTRIILAADHGQHLGALDELMLGGEGSSSKDVERFFPLLMVKDFDSHGFTASHEFMTNADVPTLAMQGLIDDPVNPFTGKVINSDEKTAHEQFCTLSFDWDTDENNGKTFLPAHWASVKDDLWNADNWTFHEGEHVLSEHKAP